MPFLRRIQLDTAFTAGNPVGCVELPNRVPLRPRRLRPSRGRHPPLQLATSQRERLMVKTIKARRSSTPPAKKTKTGHVKRICNLIPSKDTQRDWTFGDALASRALTATAALPASVDLRQSWWTIGDQ